MNIYEVINGEAVLVASVSTEEAAKETVEAWKAQGVICFYSNE